MCLLHTYGSTSFISRGIQHLCDPEVTQFHDPLEGEEDVLGLQISMQDISLVHML